MKVKDKFSLFIVATWGVFILVELVRIIIDWIS